MKNMQNEIRWLLQEKYGGAMTAAAKKDILHLKAGEPLDHIIGFVEFLDCKIMVNKKALIPRIETEFWVGQVVEQLKSKNEKLKVLDMFAGSGCIGVSIMRQITGATIVFADSQKDCLDQIRINCKANKISSAKYEIIQSDIFQNLAGKFDAIFANPPYIPTKRKNKVQASVLKYEPHAALFGGEDGLLYVRKFLASAKNFLNPRAKIYMEFDSIQKAAIGRLLKEYGYNAWKFGKDQYGKWRYVVAL